MKERPKAGDRVEFWLRRGVHKGKVIAVAETGVHFSIKTLIGGKYRYKRIGLDAIIKILPKQGDR